jgi:peptide/nickel transport system substrate-binding protein
MSFLFDTLTWKDEDGVIPWLAESWKVSEDGSTWTFTLHPDAVWHDGTPLTAEDVAFTFAYFKQHPEAYTWSWAVDQVEQAEAVDDQTVVLNLTQPIAGAHGVLIGSLPIIPKHIWEDVEDPAKYTTKEAVIGSGPFTLTEYNKEEGRYVYQANPDHFKSAPAVDTLTYIKVENPALALETGTIDYASFWGKEIDAARSFEDREPYEIISGPGFWVLQMIFNTQKAPFDQIEVRRAIAHAVSREQVVTQVTHDGAIVASPGILSPATEWHNPNLPTYAHDPDKAESTIAALGMTGRALTLITTPNYAREAELIQADLEAVGLEITVQSSDRSTVDALLREGNFDLAINGHGGLANPAILRSPTWPAETYENETYEALYQEQAGLVDEEARREIVWQLQTIIAEDLPVLTLWHPRMWTVYDATQLDTWFYTQGGVGFGIPLAMNKLIFLR